MYEYIKYGWIQEVRSKKKKKFQIESCVISFFHLFVVTSSISVILKISEKSLICFISRVTPQNLHTRIYIWWSTSGCPTVCGFASRTETHLRTTVRPKLHREYYVWYRVPKYSRSQETQIRIKFIDVKKSGLLLQLQLIDNMNGWLQ